MSLAKIGNKIFDKEVKLSSEEVELAGVKDLSKKLKQLFDSQRKLDKKQPALAKLKDEVESEQRHLKMRIGEANDLLKEFSKSAKELGVDPSSVSDYKALDIEASNSKEYL
jgi:uncharacterized phage infection (PIP) family protein YhgE